MERCFCWKILGVGFDSIYLFEKKQPLCLHVFVPNFSRAVPEQG